MEDAPELLKDLWRADLPLSVHQVPGRWPQVGGSGGGAAGCRGIFEHALHIQGF